MLTWKVGEGGAHGLLRKKMVTHTNGVALNQRYTKCHNMYLDTYRHVSKISQCVS